MALQSSVAFPNIIEFSIKFLWDGGVKIFSAIYLHQFFNPPLYEVGMYESVNEYVYVFVNDSAYFKNIALIFQKESANNIFRINNLLGITLKIKYFYIAIAMEQEKVK